MPTPHISAELNDYSNIVLMPGDPIRAKFIADNFLIDIKQVNATRNCFGYTGVLPNKNINISVQASGMGQPSLSIYVNELIKFYNIDTIIRIGTCGAFSPDIEVGSTIIGMTSSSESNFVSGKFFENWVYSPCCDFDLLKKVTNQADLNCLDYKVGQLVSIDHFYRDNFSDWVSKMIEFNILGVDMETYALYTLANKYKIKALTVNMVSDNLSTGIEFDSENRSNHNINNMVSTILQSL